MTNPIFEALSGLTPAILTDADRNIEELNTSFTLLTGWKRKDLRGKHLHTIIPERSRAAHVEHEVVYMRKPTPRPMGADREVYLLCEDGAEVLVWIGLSPIGNGKVVASILPQDVERPGPLNPQTTH